MLDIILSLSIYIRCRQDIVSYRLWVYITPHCLQTYTRETRDTPSDDRVTCLSQQLDTYIRNSHLDQDAAEGIVLTLKSEHSQWYVSSPMNSPRPIGLKRKSRRCHQTGPCEDGCTMLQRSAVHRVSIRLCYNEQARITQAIIRHTTCSSCM